MALTKPGLLGGTAATGYPSMWGGASGGTGILGYTPGSAAPAPMPTYKNPVRTGGTIYGNYVRNYPDLLAAFKDPSNSIPNIVDWGKSHWDTFGQNNPSRILPTIKQTNPNISLGDAIDLGPSATKIGSSGLPMPDVEGYSYVYPRYSWDKETGYTKGGTKSFETDINKYPYFPSMPETAGSVLYDDEGRDLHTILLGVQLVPNSWVGK